MAATMPCRVVATRVKNLSRGWVVAALGRGYRRLALHEALSTGSPVTESLSLTADASSIAYAGPQVWTDAPANPALTTVIMRLQILPGLVFKNALHLRVNPLRGRSIIH